MSDKIVINKHPLSFTFVGVILIIMGSSAIIAAPDSSLKHIAIFFTGVLFMSVFIQILFLFIGEDLEDALTGDKK